MPYYESDGEKVERLATDQINMLTLLNLRSAKLTEVRGTLVKVIDILKKNRRKEAISLLEELASEIS